MFDQFTTDPYSFDEVTSSPITPVTPSQDVLRLGRLLPRSIYLGCASWNFPGWKGIVWGVGFAAWRYIQHKKEMERLARRRAERRRRLEESGEWEEFERIRAMQKSRRAEDE